MHIGSPTTCYKPEIKNNMNLKVTPRQIDNKYICICKIELKYEWNYCPNCGAILSWNPPKKIEVCMG